MSAKMGLTVVFSLSAISIPVGMALSGTKQPVPVMYIYVAGTDGPKFLTKSMGPGREISNLYGERQATVIKAINEDGTTFEFCSQAPVIVSPIPLPNAK